MENSPSSGRIGDFIDNGDGTVTDTRTGLMWMRCALGQTWDGKTCIGKAKRYTWDKAVALLHSFAGHDDWRLPNIDELKSIVDKARGRPAIDTAAFPNTPERRFWSASANAGNSDFAWKVDFSYGGDLYPDFKTDTYHVRLVRGGQSFGVLNGDALDKATGSPAKEAPVVIQGEAHKDESTNIVDLPIREEEPSNFVVRSDGTVTDTRTGLMWMRCALGQTWDGTTCVGEVQGYTWDEAMALRHDFAGYDDWRLPDIDELKSIVDKTRRPAIDIEAFLNTPKQRFWSASAYAGVSRDAWYVYFNGGGDYTGSKTGSNQVRLVRGGQSFGALNGDAIDQATDSPAEEAPVVIQIETRKDESTNIIESSICEEASGHFVIRSDGTATDTRTGLMWMRCALGQIWDGSTCVGEAKGYTWDEAMALRHGFAGYDDWRLPDIDELKSIVDKTRDRPAIDTMAFPKALCSVFWSASANAYYSDLAWFVGFSNGYDGTNDKANSFQVRLVRGGQYFGALNDDAIGQATGSPVKEAPVVNQVETHKDESTNIIDSPIQEEISGNFIIRSDGTVTDTRTGLMWMRCALGQNWDGSTCVGKANKYTWNNAMALRHDFAGYDDWRLPDIDELTSIVDRAKVEPAIDTAAFPNTSDHDTLDLDFWSASAYAGTFSDGTFSDGWCVMFYDGSVESFDNYVCYVRLVRGGQPLGALNGDAIDQAPSFSVKVALEAIQTTPPTSEITTVVERLQLLEEKLSGSLARVERMGDAHASAKSMVRAAIAFIRQQPELFPAEIAELRGFLAVTGATPVSAPAATNQPVPAEPATLKQVIAWLMTQETVALPDLRTRLLPLDLLPDAVINDINERALDLTGDLALEDDGDCIIIVREVLARVMSAW